MKKTKVRWMIEIAIVFVYLSIYPTINGISAPIPLDQQYFLLQYKTPADSVLSYTAEGVFQTKINNRVIGTYNIKLEAIEIVTGKFGDEVDITNVSSISVMDKKPNVSEIQYKRKENGKYIHVVGEYDGPVGLLQFPDMAIKQNQGWSGECYRNINKGAISGTSIFNLRYITEKIYQQGTDTIAQIYYEGMEHYEFPFTNNAANTQDYRYSSETDPILGSTHYAGRILWNIHKGIPISHLLEFRSIEYATDGQVREYIQTVEYKYNTQGWQPIPPEYRNK